MAPRPASPRPGSDRPGAEPVVTRAGTHLFQLVEFLAAVCLAAVAVLSLYQVLTRFVINLPSVWSEPAIRLFMVWSTFLGVAMLTRQGMLISISFLRDRAGPRLTHALNLVALIGGTVFFGCAAWYGFALIGRVRRQILSGLDISIAWAYLAVPVGAVLCLLGLWIWYWRTLKPALARSPSGARLQDDL